MSDNTEDVALSLTDIDSENRPFAHPDDSTDSSIRYAAYANRFRTIFLASHRYIAYTSDIGESFRPAAHPNIVRFCYGISWTYILGDVGFEAWKAKLRSTGQYTPGLKPWDPVPKPDPVASNLAEANEFPDWRLVALQRGLFQSIASMGLPAFTIHSTVKYATEYANKNIKNAKIRLWGPIGLGLAVVPVLPYLFDKPVEHVLDITFEKLNHYIAHQNSTKKLK